MSANAYARIAERYQVLASDDEAVERFFLDVAPTLSRVEREAIVAELRDDEATAEPRSWTTDLPIDVPMFSIDDAPPIVRPNILAQLVGELSATVEKRVGDRLDLLARAVDRLSEQIGELNAYNDENRSPSAPRTENDEAESASSRRQGVRTDRARLIADVIEGRVFTHADSNESVRNVTRRMVEAKVDAAAVLDQGTLIGVFSLRDLMVRVVAHGLDPDGTSVSSVMTEAIVIIHPWENVIDALQKMHNFGCQHLPVVDDGNVVGVISLRDLLNIDSDTGSEKATLYDILMVAASS